jgi:CRISPR-associated endonuclease Csn1
MTVFSFDVGKGSLGICVRQGLNILELDSKLVDATYPCITANGRGLTTRVRMARTRRFHKARLTWLKCQWEQTGLTALAPNSPAWSMEYQAGKYASGILLRCALLMGKTAHPDGTPFTDADLFKALYSAVRKRGYGDVVWKTTSDKPKNEEKIKKKESELTQEEKDEKANKERSASYLKEMATYTTEHYFHPCFMEAARLGLWDRIHPAKLETHLKNKAGFEPIRGENLVAPRLLRIEEFEALFAKIQALRPRQLANINPRNWAEGRILLPFSDKTQRGFASYYATAKKEKLRIEGFSAYLEKQLKDVRQCRGSKRSDPKGDPETPFDWQGVFNQKVPRFDNRIIAKCAVFSSRNVCKAEEPLAKDVKILLALKNMTFEVNTVLPDGLKTVVSRKLLATELQTLWELFQADTQKSLTPTWLDKHLAQVVGADYVAQGKLAKKRFEYVQKQTNDSGRSRFSRPALALVKALLLSGQSPAEFIGVCKGNGQLPAWKGNEAWIDLKSTQKEGITHAELEEAEKKLGKTWDSLAIGDNRDAAFEASTALAEQFEGEALYAERLKAIYKRIGNVNNPVVRHRLELLIHQVHKLRKAHGTPAKVMIEFVREGLNAQEAKERESFIKAQEKKRQDWKKRLEDMGVHLTPFNITKLRLWEEQQEVCPYSGRVIGFDAHLFTPAVEVDHIIPVSRGGTDALHNKVVCFREENQEKQNRTPFEWLKSTDWKGYTARIESLRQKGLSSKKAKILVAMDEKSYEKALETYTGLAETSYIARLSQEVIAFYFGWGLQVEGENRRLFVTNGEETAAFRRKYELNELLYEGREADWKALQADKTTDYDRKLRENKKHHALDAYAISFAEEHREYFERYPGEGKKHWRLKNVDENRLKGTIQAGLAHILPAPIVRNKAEMDFEETLYGLRLRTNAKGKREYLVVKQVKPATLKPEQLKKLPAKLYDKDLAQALETHLKGVADFSQAMEGFKHPIHQNPVKRATVIVSVVDEADLRRDEQGRLHIGEYVNVAKAWDTTQPCKYAQLKRTKQHKGQLLFYDAKGKVRVRPVYGYESEQTVRQSLKAQGLTLYQNGKLFYSGVIVTISKPIEHCGYTIPANQPFRLMSIIYTGQCAIELSNGVKFNGKEGRTLLNINTLIENNLKLYLSLFQYNLKLVDVFRFVCYINDKQGLFLVLLLN